MRGPEGTDLMVTGGGGGRVGIISSSSSFGGVGSAMRAHCFTRGPVLLFDISKIIIMNIN